MGASEETRVTLVMTARERYSLTECPWRRLTQASRRRNGGVTPSQGAHAGMNADLTKISSRRNSQNSRIGAGPLSV